MNILFIAQFKIDQNKGGVQRVTATLAKAFLKRGFKVYYLSLSKGVEGEMDGVSQYYIPYPDRFSAKSNIRYIRELIGKKQINIVINQAGIYPRPFKLIKASLPSCVKLYSVHHNCIACMQANYRDRFLAKSGFYRLLKYIDFPLVWRYLRAYNQKKYELNYKNTIFGSDKLVLLSEYFIPELNTYLKDFPVNKVVAIPNPAPFDVVKGIEEKKDNRLLYIGRVVYPQKRADLLIDIWKKLYQQHPDWQLDVVGEGALRKDLEQRVVEEGIERIVFHGTQDPRPFYKKAKIFCMTSAFEGYGMVLVEAQAYGLVPFAFNTFSVLSDIVQNNENGVIVLPFDINEYAEQLSLLMRDENRRIAMAENGQLSIVKFNAEAISRKWIRLFNQTKTGQ